MGSGPSSRKPKVWEPERSRAGSEGWEGWTALWPECYIHQSFYCCDLITIVITSGGGVVWEVIESWESDWDFINEISAHVKEAWEKGPQDFCSISTGKQDSCEPACRPSKYSKSAIILISDFLVRNKLLLFYKLPSPWCFVPGVLS